MLPQIDARLRVPLHCQPNLNLGRRFRFPNEIPYLSPAINPSATLSEWSGWKPSLVLDQVRRPQLMEIMEHSYAIYQLSR